MKRYLSIVLIFLLLLSGCSGSSGSSDTSASSGSSDYSDSTEAIAEADPTFSPSDFDESGTCGDNAYWGWNEANEELIIWGSGKMYDYEAIPYEYASDHYYPSAPWGERSIYNLKIYGISYIGENAFVEACYTLETVLISDSVTHIGCGALDGWMYLNTSTASRCDRVEFTGTEAQLKAVRNDGNDIFWVHGATCSDGNIPYHEIAIE